MIFDTTTSIAKKLIALVCFFIFIVFGILTYSVFEKFTGGNQDSKVRGQQEVVIKDLSTSNDHLKETIKTQVKADDITQNVLQSVSDNQQANKDTKDIAHQQVEKKVTEIKKVYNDKISQSTNPQESVQLIKEKEAAVSRTRISALWVNYCKHSPQEIDCKEQTT